MCSVPAADDCSFLRRGRNKNTWNSESIVLDFGEKKTNPSSVVVTAIDTKSILYTLFRHLVIQIYTSQRQTFLLKGLFILGPQLWSNDFFLRSHIFLLLLCNTIFFILLFDVYGLCGHIAFTSHWSVLLRNGARAFIFWVWATVNLRKDQASHPPTTLWLRAWHSWRYFYINVMLLLCIWYFNFSLVNIE